MDTNLNNLEVQSFEAASQDVQLQTLSDFQLMLVGGGSGDVAFG